MNIFFLDKNVHKCAQYHCDKHVVKMILELAQLMSAAHHELGSEYAEFLYRKTHVNHPCAIWTRTSKDNYFYVYRLFCALCQEYTHRYGKMHKTFRERDVFLIQVPKNIPDIGMTPFPQCMPDEYKQADPVEAYREYYVFEKNHLFKWTKRERPEWIENYQY